jgi:uncharacterized membrane protein required for colicin V production
MIAVAAQSASTVANNLSFSWFDGVFIAMLGFGLFRGRRNGMAKELLPLLQWLALVIVCGLGYPTIAQMCINYFAWGKTISDVTGYLALAVVIFIFFIVLKNLFTARLVASGFFKGGEYYLGMVAGLVRFACILLFALALMNAPFYTPQELEVARIQARNTFGGGIMNGSFFPSFHDVQDAVFVQSATGHLIKDHLGTFLINTTGPNGKNVNVPAKKITIIHIGN